MVQHGVSVVRSSSNETTCKKTKSCKIPKEYGGEKYAKSRKLGVRWMVSRV